MALSYSTYIYLGFEVSGFGRSNVRTQGSSSHRGGREAASDGVAVGGGEEDVELEAESLQFVGEVAEERDSLLDGCVVRRAVVGGGHRGRMAHLLPDAGLDVPDGAEAVAYIVRKVIRGRPTQS